MNIPKIVEGLHCCSGSVFFRDCESCPYLEEKCCLDKLLTEAETAIRKLEAEQE